jgi:DNA-directed RNA polymerase subunit K/omega
MMSGPKVRSVVPADDRLEEEEQDDVTSIDGSDEEGEDGEEEDDEGGEDENDEGDIDEGEEDGEEEDDEGGEGENSDGTAMSDVDVDDNDDDDDEEEANEENRLQKLSSVTAENIITEFHPESRLLGLSEVKALAVVQRQLPDGLIVDDPLHRTLPFLTKYEKARVLGLRIAQLNDGADTLLVPAPDDSIIDNSIIAEMELQQKVIPFIIQRPLPNGVSEYWHLRDLELIL